MSSVVSWNAKRRKPKPRAAFRFRRPAGFRSGDLLFFLSPDVPRRKSDRTQRRSFPPFPNVSQKRLNFAFPGTENSPFPPYRGGKREMDPFWHFRETIPRLGNARIGPLE